MQMGIDQLAQVIVGAWRLGGDDTRIPTSHGLMDRALSIAAERGAFPDWARQRLHFVDSRIGLQCIELPSILEWAQRAHLTAAPNPSYQYTDVQVSENVARRLIGRLGVSTEEATQWGHVLREAMASAQEQLEGYETAQVEEY